MRKLFNNKVRVIVIAAVILTAALTILGGVTGNSVPKMLVQGVMTPLRAGANALTVQAERFYNYIFRYEALLAENEILKERISQMEDDARLADSVERENQRLREALDLKSYHEDYKMVDANIIAWSSTDWTNTLTINRGSKSGIEVDMCAITANGQVVGLVTEVGPNYAVVKTILDSTLEISATISSTGNNGMVTGGYIDGNAKLLKMDYLPSSAIILNKDQVVTSGSTVYPRNLILGYIIDAGFDDTGVAKYAILQPAADIDSLEQIFILTEYSTE
jgi:rod shape-determining protein MreC